MSIPITGQIACVQRELHMRRSCYPRWVEEGRMTQAEATAQLGAMEGVLETLLMAHSVLIWAADHHPKPRGTTTQEELFT